jgi:insertion element IS1 protein InsB
LIANINREYLENFDDLTDVAVELISYNEIAGELDEMWSFVQNKGNQRWLWLAIHHETRVVLAYTFGTRTDNVFRELKGLLEPFGITAFLTDDWGAYSRNLPEHNHYISKSLTQRIERKNLTLRTRIKRLARKTICFSKSTRMHDIVIGLAINYIEFSCFHFIVENCFNT